MRVHFTLSAERFWRFVNRFKKFIFLITTAWVLFFSISSRGQNYFIHLLGLSAYPNFTWVGLGADANWNTPLNWSNSAVPGVGDTAHFIGAACTANCSPTMNVAVSVAGIDIGATYAGTITQTNTITVGATGWTQAGGTFVPSAHNITINGPFILSGGTYTATNQTWTQGGSLTLSGAPTFNHNSGNILFTTPGITITPSTAAFNTITFNSCSLVNTLVGSWTVNGDLNFSDICGGNHGLNGGTILLSGNLTASNVGSPGTTLVKMVGSSNQSITGSASALIPNLEIASTGGTVSYIGTLLLNGNYTNTTGTIDVGTSTLIFNFAGQSISPKAIDYNNISFNFCGGTSTLNGTFNVAGTLSLINICGGTNDLNGGTLVAKGNVVANNVGLGGTVQLKIAGTGNQTITGVSTALLPYLEIISTGGTVTYSGTLTLAKTYLYTSGTVDASTSTLQFITAGQGITPGAINHNNVTFNFCGGTTTITGVLTVGGTLSLSTSACGGTYALNGSIVANGNVTALNAGMNGTATITFGGNTNTTMNRAVTAALPTGAVSVSKNVANNVALASNVSWSGAGQSLTVSTGTLNVAGFALVVNSTLSISAGAKLLCSGGTASAGAWSIIGEISCGTGQGITWTGIAADNNWNTAGNWTNNTIPGAGDVAIFNGNCAGANCNSNINVAANVRGINILSSYTGTLTQQAGNSLTVGAAGFSQAGGTFVGGNSAIAIAGPFALSAGSFTSTSNTLTHTGTTWAITGAPTYLHNSGTTLFNAQATITPGTSDYYNVSFVGPGGSTFNLNAGTMSIAGLLTINNGTACCGSSQMTNGNLNAKGDVSVLTGSGGSAILRLVGTGNQTYTGAVSGIVGNLVINSSGGTITFAGTVVVSGTYTYTAGTVDWGTSLLSFRYNNVIIPGPINYKNVYFGTSTTAGNDNLSGGTMKVLGTLTIDVGFGCCSTSVINNGTIEASGDVNLTTGSAGGTALIKLVGSTNQTVTGTVNAYSPSFEIASTGGTVYFIGTNRIGGGSFKYTSGVVDFGVSSLQFLNSTTITPGALLYGNVVLGAATNNPAIDLNAGTMTVMGSLNLDFGGGCCGTSQLKNGTVEAKGNVSFLSGSSGSALVKISGTTNQTVTGVNSGSTPNLEIASTGGIVTLAGTINAGATFTYTSGTVDPSTSTVQFVTTQTVVPNSITLNNVTFTGAGLTQNLNAQILNVNGVLTINDTGTGSLNSGTINAAGNVAFQNNGRSGTAIINYTGAVTSTLTVGTSSTLLTTVHSASKTGGASLKLASDVAFSAVGRNFNVTSGIFDLDGNDFSVNNVLTNSVGATIKCSGGVLTYGSIVNSGTVNCPGFATYDFNWTGAGGNSNWNTAGNWQGGVAPTSVDVAYFDPTYCGVNCDATFNVDPNVRGIWTFSTYNGTITQPAGVAVNIGRFGWRHQNGIFVGGNSNMLIAGGLTVNAGTFTMSSATTTLGEVRCGTKTTLNFSGGILAHNNGRLKIAHQRPVGFSCHTVANMGFPNGFTVYDFETEGQSSNGWNTTMPATNGTLLNVLNNFYDNGNFPDFNIDLAGNLFVNNTNNTFSTTRQIRMMGTGTQEYTFGASSVVANKLKVEKASGVVQSAAGNTNFGVFQFELAQGTFTAPTGTFTVGGPILSTMSSTFFLVAPGQTFNHNNGLIKFAFARAAAASASSTGTISIPAGTDFYDVELYGEPDALGWPATYASASTINVLRNFTHTGAALNASWTIQGDVTIGAYTNGGTGTITLNGTGAQKITAYPGSLPAGGTWTVNKPSGTVTMYGSGLGLATAGQDFNLVAGTVDLNVAVLNVKDQFNISPGATVNCTNGYYTAGTLNNSGTLSCAGTSYVKTILADNPKVYYRMGEPSTSYKAGSSASGNGYQATPTNPSDIAVSVNRVSSLLTDKAVTTSNNGYYDITATVALAATHTMEVWFLAPFSATGGTWNTLFRNGGIAASGNHHILIKNSDGHIGVWDNLGATNFRDSGYAMTSVSPGWHHLVAIGSGTSTTFYIDKVNVGSAPIKNTQAISQFGGYAGGGQSFGTFDEVAIYDYALTQNQIDAHYAAGAPTQVATAWFDDSLPAGATTSVTSDSWNWVGSNPTPNTGTLAHKSDLVAGIHQHYFQGVTTPWPIYTGDVFYVDVYINPVNPPTEIMLQLNDGTGTPWEHRVYWGVDSTGWGTNGTASRRYKGVIPALGSWVRLTFTAAEVGMGGLSLRGVAFTLNDGQVTWDQFGVYR